MNTIVSLEWVKERLDDPGLTILDCRFALGQPQTGRDAYERAHLPGAVYLDLERDMSGPVTEHGGRHPIPDLGRFTLRLGELGVDESRTVVCYDDQGGAMAARCWWMLRLLDHPDVRIMDRGFGAWQAAGYPVRGGAEQPEPRTFIPKVNTKMMAQMEEVRAAIGSDRAVLVDSREAPRYRGEQEPIDKAAGHIPGAVNRFWKEALRADGSWRSAEEQRERFADLPRDREIIVYCGSGVTACPNVLSLMEAGFPNVRLYLGSWSDWISYEENPIASGEESR